MLKFDGQTTENNSDETKRLLNIGMFSVIVAHELRNPLNVIKMAMYNIHKKNKDDSLNVHLANIDKKILESSQIIENLLNYSTLKMPQYEKVCVKSLLDDCIHGCRNKYLESIVDIHRSYGDEDMFLVEVDPVYITRVFWNVLDNIFQAFLDGNGQINIKIDYMQENNMCMIVFKDNGVGVKDEDLEYVFKPFFSTKSKGTGLGLSVSRQIIHLHGGEIVFESKFNEGSIVTISLPISHTLPE